MVASTPAGNCPALSRCVRQVFPTAESPITSTLKVRQRVSSEDTLPRELENSRDDSIYTSQLGVQGRVSKKEAQPHLSEQNFNLTPGNASFWRSFALKRPANSPLRCPARMRGRGSSPRFVWDLEGGEIKSTRWPLSRRQTNTHLCSNFLHLFINLKIVQFEHRILLCSVETAKLHLWFILWTTCWSLSLMHRLDHHHICRRRIRHSVSCWRLRNVSC